VDCHSHWVEFQIKTKLIADAREQVEGISANYNMGLITNNERYNKLLMYGLCKCSIDRISNENIREDQQGFNSVYMMLDSGARFQRTNSSVNWYAWFDG
jgi:DNA-directed RNA polymerase subunit beta'